MTETTATLLIPVTPYKLGETPARCYDHGESDHVGYLVTFTHFDPAACETRFEDIEYVDGPTNYARALEIVRGARAVIARGIKDATYAVIHHIYEVDGVKHRHV